jgi:hypothetical protein
MVKFQIWYLFVSVLSFSGRKEQSRRGCKGGVDLGECSAIRTGIYGGYLARYLLYF